MTSVSARAFLTGAFLWALMPGLCASRAHAAGPPERLIIYVNEDNARVRQAIDLLETALDKTGVSRRHRLRLRHLVANLWDAREIEEKLRQALEMRPAAIIATNSEIASIAKTLTRDVPIIFGSHQDPISLGLVDSLGHPGGNLTGFTYFVPIDQKRLELLRQIAPKAKKLGILVDRWWLQESGGPEVLISARDRLGFEAELFSAETIAGLREVLATSRARQMDAWYVPVTVLPFEEPAALIALLESRGKPVVFPGTQFVELGGLISYQQTFTLADSARLLAGMIGLVLDGVPTSEIPIERPKSFEIAVNVDAAKRLGLTIPMSLIKRADRVILDGGSK